VLDAVIEYMPSPVDLPPVSGTLEDNTEGQRTPKDEEPFAGLAFKIATDPFVGNLTFLRVYSGVLSSGDTVFNPIKDRRERIGRLVQMHANERSEIKEVRAGDIAAAVGLKDVTTGDTLLFRQLNKVDDEDYQVVDGLKIRVLGAYKPTFQNAAYLNNVSANRRALGGVNFTLPFFEGGASAAVDFFGSTLDPATMPDSFTTVQVRFSHTATQKAYRFVRMQTVTGDPPAAPPDRGYLQRGFVDVPFQVWDATNNIQLDVAVLEKEVTDDAGNRIEGAAQLATSDSTWGPDAGTDGGREFIWPLRRPYSDTPKPELAVDRGIFDGVLPALYFVAPRLRAATDVVDDGDAFEWTWANPATANDIYDISTSKLVRNNASFATGKLSAIRVVPNPYYNRSTYELNQFSRVVRFMNMPEQATVRIFNLGGQLVRTLQKTNTTSSVLDWDLLTSSQLPVASGIYIYHVEAPGVGTTFGRLVVFMEAERLNNF